jgi:uncharacterized membrane protein
MHAATKRKTPVGPKSRRKRRWRAVAPPSSGYGAVVSALALGPGPISELRETSVIFAAVIGRAFLDEALTRRRGFACIVVALGAACLSG